MDAIHGTLGGGIDGSESGSEVGERLSEGAGYDMVHLASRQLSGMWSLLHLWLLLKEVVVPSKSPLQSG